MALSYTRLLGRKSLDARKFQGLFTSSSVGISSSLSRCATAQVCETHDEKNKRLKRPLSPHLTIYQPQLTSMLSITHRATGMALSGFAAGAGSAALFVQGGMCSVIESIDALCIPIPILFLGKFIIAWPAMFHYFNGIRHLLWDLGQFLTIKQVYGTGWSVVAISTIVALALAAIF